MLPLLLLGFTATTNEWKWSYTFSCHIRTHTTQLVRSVAKVYRDKRKNNVRKKKQQAREKNCRETIIINMYALECMCVLKNVRQHTMKSVDFLLIFGSLIHSRLIFIQNHSVEREANIHESWYIYREVHELYRWLLLLLSTIAYVLCKKCGGIVAFYFINFYVRVGTAHSAIVNWIVSEIHRV